MSTETSIALEDLGPGGSLEGKLLSIQSGLASTVPGASEALSIVKKLSNYLPPGRIRDAYQSGLAMIPGGLIFSLLKKKQFSSGQYWLGEKFMYHVLGKLNIRSRSAVPDDYVEAAQLYFTQTTGCPINSMEDLYALFEGVNTYLDRDPNLYLRDRVSMATVQRGHAITKQFPESLQLWDFEAAALAIAPVVVSTVSASPVVQLGSYGVPVPVIPPLSTADNPEELPENVVTPQWWSTNFWLLLGAGLLLLILLGSVFGFRKK